MDALTPIATVYAVPWSFTRHALNQDEPMTIDERIARVKELIQKKTLTLNLQASSA